MSVAGPGGSPRASALGTARTDGAPSAGGSSPARDGVPSVQTGAGRLRPVLGLVGPWRRDARRGIASGVTQQVLFIAGASIAAYVVGRAVRGATYDSISLYLLGLVIIVLPQVRAPWLEALSFQAIGNRLGVDLRGRVYAALAALTPAGLSGRRSGELGYTAMADVGVLGQFCAETLPALVVAAVVPVIALVALAVIAWQLALVVLPFLVLAAVVPPWLHAGSERRHNELGDHLADLSAEIIDSVQGLREIVSFGAVGPVLADLGSREATARRMAAACDRRAAAESAVSEMLATAGSLLVLGTGAVLVDHAGLSRTLLAPATVLAALAFGPVGRLARAAKTIGQVAVAGERVLALLSAPVPVQDRRVGDRPGPAVVLPPRPGVVFDHVSFRYGAEGPEALHDVSFVASPGETVALVGHSGAGKSTCVNLLLRFWDVEGGSVTVGGSDVRDLPQADLHRAVGLVAQDVYLFNTTVRENLRLGCPDATDDQVERAARSALAWELISALPDGLDTSTGERGAQLSGGERQRLAIARVFLLDPSVLVLDEPVSNLDTESERALAEAMARLRAGRTTIIVAHRLSTIRGADRIVVLDHGSVVEQGAHPELIAQGGAYSKLVATQLR